VQFLFSSFDDAGISRYKKHEECVLKILDGYIFEISFSRQSLTATDFRNSGTKHIMLFDFITCCTDMLMALCGTISIDEKQPSFTCCILQRSSSSTII